MGMEMGMEMGMGMGMEMEMEMVLVGGYTNLGHCDNWLSTSLENDV